MFDHVVFGVSDYAASKAFFLKALEPLGVSVVLKGPLGVELSPKTVRRLGSRARTSPRGAAARAPA